MPGGLRMYHVDAYRLDDPEEASAAGLLDDRQADGVTVVEWADRLDGWMPVERLDIRLSTPAGDPTAPHARLAGARAGPRPPRAGGACRPVIIAIDAASTDLSVALAEPDGTLIAEDAWSSAQRQSAELFPRLLALLAGAGRPLVAATALAVGTGPGSFTGLRVAMALAKGLAIGLARPAVGVPSLRAWLDADPDATAAIARAGARDAYVLMREADAPLIVDRDELDSLTGPVIAASELAAAFGLDGSRAPRGASAIARRAAERLATEPAGDDVSTLEPIYLRAPRGVAVESEERVRWL